VRLQHLMGTVVSPWLGSWGRGCERARMPAGGGVVAAWRAGRIVAGEKTISLGQKHPPTCDFYVSAPPPTSLNPDRWAQREGYGGPDLSNKCLQLFSIFIVIDRFPLFKL